MLAPVTTPGIPGREARSETTLVSQGTHWEPQVMA